MAYLNKRQYEYRRESAAARNLKNEEIAVQNGMTEEQASLISELCSTRHEFHCNMDAFVKGGNDDCIRLRNKFENLCEHIRENNLPELNVYDTIIDIDDMDGLIYDYGDDVPADHDSKEFQDWYADNYDRIYSELSDVNKSIEDYLSAIDKKYKTSYCPTGALRAF